MPLTKALAPPHHVYVVGGSLGGLMYALVFLTHCPKTKVTILERSPTSLLHNQGAGIVADAEVQSFFDKYVQPGRSISVKSQQRLYLDRNGAIIPGSVSDHAQRMTSWDTLYRLLRWRVDGRAADEYLQSGTPSPLGIRKAEYRHGCFMKNIEDNADNDELTLRWTQLSNTDPELSDKPEANSEAEEHTATTPLLIAADGASSTVRSQLLPSVKRTYAGYVAFRGTVPESSLSPSASSVFIQRFAFYHAQATQILAYTIPGQGGSLEVGKRLVNWVWYVNYPENSPEFDEVMTDTTAKRHGVTLPVGGMQQQVWQQRVVAAKEILPPQFAELVEKTEMPFVQAITDVAPEENLLLGGKVVLVGDALAGFRPHTAASTGQAARGAITLGRWLEGAIGEEEYRQECLEFAVQVQRHGVVLGDRSQFGSHPLAR